MQKKVDDVNIIYTIKIQFLIIDATFRNNNVLI